MYQRYSERSSWKFSMVSCSEVRCSVSFLFLAFKECVLTSTVEHNNLETCYPHIAFNLPTFIRLNMEVTRRV